MSKKYICFCRLGLVKKNVVKIKMSYRKNGHFKSMFQFTIDTIVCLNLESIKNKEELQKNKRKTCNENGEKTKEIKRIYITQEVT